MTQIARLVSSCGLILCVLTLSAVPTVQAADGVQSIGACRTIDKPGSYVLAKNLDAVGDCLVIKTGSVTVDLAGYTISGAGSGRGITNNVPTVIAGSDITVRNGTVRQFLHGIELQGVGHIVEHIRAVENLGVGILVGGTVTSFESTGLGCPIVSSPPPAEGVVRNSVASRNRVGIVAGINIATSAGGDFCPAFGSGRFNILQNTAVDNTQTIDIFVSCPGVVVQNATSGGGSSILAAGCTRSDNSPAP